MNVIHLLYYSRVCWVKCLKHSVWTAPGCFIRWSDCNVRCSQIPRGHWADTIYVKRCEQLIPWSILCLPPFSLAPTVRSIYHVRHVLMWLHCPCFPHNIVTKSNPSTVNLFHLLRIRLASELIGSITSEHPFALILADIRLWLFPDWLSYQHFLWANSSYQTQE